MGLPVRPKQSPRKFPPTPEKSPRFLCSNHTDTRYKAPKHFAGIDAPDSRRTPPQTSLPILGVTAITSVILGDLPCAKPILPADLLTATPATQKSHTRNLRGSESPQPRTVRANYSVPKCPPERGQSQIPHQTRRPVAQTVSLALPVVSHR